MSQETSKPSKPEKRGWGFPNPRSVVEARTEEVMLLLAHNPGILRGKIHQHFREIWKDKTGRPADWRTIDSYVSRAKEAALKRTQRDKNDWVATIASRYEVDLASKDGQTRHRAAQGLRELLGLDAPRVTKTDLTSGGEKIVTLTLDPKLVTGEDE